MSLDEEEPAKWEIDEQYIEDAVVPVIGYKAEELRAYRDEMMQMRRGFEVLFVGLGIAVVLIALVK